MLAVIQKSNQVSFLQGQLIATQDRSLRADRRWDELEAPTAMGTDGRRVKGDNPDKVGQQRRACGTSIVVLIDAPASDLQALFRFRNPKDA